MCSSGTVSGDKKRLGGPYMGSDPAALSYSKRCVSCVCADKRFLVYITISRDLIGYEARRLTAIRYERIKEAERHCERIRSKIEWCRVLINYERTSNIWQLFPLTSCLRRLCKA